MITLKCRDEFNKMITRKGFSKRAFAYESDLSVATIVQISNGKQSPRPDTAKKICNTLNVDFDDVFLINEKRGEFSVKH